MKCVSSKLVKGWVTLACVFAAVLTLTGASEWEGAAGIAGEGELPGSGYYVATDSFPKNTVVDITNLENGKNIRAIVASSLESPGLLALLSGNVANLLGLHGGSIGRIRMIQPSDLIAFSRFTDETGLYGESDYLPPEPAPFIGANDTDALSEESEWDEFPFSTIVDLPNGERHDYREAPAESAEPYAPETVTDNYDYALVPVEERPPEDRFYEIAEEDIIPSIDNSAWERDYSVIAAVPPEKAPPPEPDYSSFSSIPLITSLEQGKYYVQIGAFSKRELVDSVVSRIDANYPLALQNAGSSDKPLYRILLGPLNLGESGAMLQRVKSIGYKDAFIRQ